MPAARKSAKKNAQKTHRRKPVNFSRYIAKFLRQASPQTKLSLSSKSMAIVNSFAFDMFDRIATEAAALVRVNKKATLSSRAIQTAVRLVLPAGISRHAISESTKAVAKLSA